MLTLPLLLLCRYQWHTTQTLSLPKTHRWKLQYNVILGSLIVLLFLFEFDRVPIGVIKIRYTYTLYWMQLLVFTTLCVTIFPAAYAISDFTLISTCTDSLHSALCLGKNYDLVIFSTGISCLYMLHQRRHLVHSWYFISIIENTLKNNYLLEVISTSQSVFKQYYFKETSACLQENNWTYME